MGDELMAAGEARRLGGNIQIVDRMGRPRWHPVWDYCPDITPNGRPLKNAGGCRPYIDAARSTKQRWAFKSYKPTPARLELAPDERGRGCIYIEPTIKNGASPNKQWDGWKEVSKSGHRFVQCGPPGTLPLPGAKFVMTANVIEAMRVLAACDGAVVHEGGMHHAAAALGIRAVVLFGAFITPQITGYESHVNLWVDDPAAVGWRIPNKACLDAWAHITPEKVIACL